MMTLVRHEMANNNAKEDQKKKPQPQLLKLDKAFKLAEQWVNNMSKTSVNEKLTSVELEGRPLRLGIGATVPKESKFTHSNNPIERKLLAKLHNDKRNTAKKHEELATSAKDENADEDSEEDESESKTRAFGKKRPPASISHRQMKKMRR
ncbi:hypothetical protein ACS0TY_019408 [Phlomoides rotata]